MRMKHLITLLSFVCLTANAQSSGEDRFGDAHWKIHFTGAIASGALASHYIDNKWIAFGVAEIPLQLRELWKREHGFSNFTTSRNVAHLAGVAIGIYGEHCIYQLNSVQCNYQF